MTDEEIHKKINQIEGIGGMTVNERLFATNLRDSFDNAQKTDKDLERRILSALKVDDYSITKILK